MDANKDRMKCEKYRADISVSTCIARQTHSKKTGNGNVIEKGWCLKCKQGEEILENYNIDLNKQPAPVPPKKADSKPDAGEKKTKRCSGPLCKKEKDLPLSSFGKNRSKPDGLMLYCKKCQKHFNDNYQKKKKLGNKAAGNQVKGIPEITSEPIELESEALELKSGIDRLISIELTIKVDPEVLKSIFRRLEN